MPAEIHNRRHIGWGATTFVAAATLAVLALPAASAFDDVPQVDDCSGGTCVVPSSYVVGHAYTVYPGTPARDVLRVSVFDNGTCLGGFSYSQPGNTVPWVPTTAGTHEITIKYSVSEPFVLPAPTKLTVTVLAAPSGTPAASPTPAAQCTVTGSGTGSAGPLGSGSF